jgi:flagellar basal-body rod protein FlgC
MAERIPPAPQGRNPMLSTAASALRAQQARMRIIAENIANANSTGPTPGSEPYRRKAPVFEAQKLGRGGPTGVELAKVVPDERAFRTEYDPGHPAADEKGYVKLPNVDGLVEALDLREAQRAYEANLNVIETARAVESRTLDILKR